ncbi:VOC family protein [Ornithinimicrobium sp. F0845]|uniref:VOC family protein n=1 Tax=Ornithinimicrobium sp. F0845 TaxID=2926412 RepID=UPI001FF3BDA4|nr:VOC family protein [Ornithinimicrobium sp. F0845]MCK0112104.1 VOC family protein [Ornithinimicrobium sp. F0845]
MTQPRIQATSVSISTPDPRALAAFYARLLGVEVRVSEGPREGEPATAGWAQIGPAEGHLMMTLNFEWDEHYVPPVWPSRPPSRLGWPSVGDGIGAAPLSSDPVTSIPTAQSAVTVGAAPQQAMTHLDLWVDDIEASVAWALECGATEHQHQPQEHVRVMIDPHGHPFCLFAG